MTGVQTCALPISTVHSLPVHLVEPLIVSEKELEAFVGIFNLSNMPGIVDEVPK